MTDIMLVGPKTCWLVMRVEHGVKVDDESSRILRVCIALWGNPQTHQSLDQRQISHRGHWTKEAPHHQRVGIVQD